MRFLRLLAPALLALMALPMRAQASFYYAWQVTHDAKLVAALTPLEAARAGLEANLAAQQATNSGIWTFATGSENYSWMRSYATMMRALRNLQRVKQGIALTKLPVWTVLPRINFVAPVEYRDESGKPLVIDREVASLSVVPPGYQAHWNVSDYYDDDEVFGATNVKGGGKQLINFQYPHKLSDVQLTFSPSPFLDDYASDESQAIDDLKAHFYEATLDAAARLAGFGVRMNPTAMTGGWLQVEGRLTPSQIKLQASLYEGQALETIEKIFQLYVNHGVPFDVANRMVQRDRDFWNGYGTRLRVLGDARSAFVMNLMNEVHESLGRLENSQRRHKVDETDEAMQHLGQKQNPDGTWSGFLENSSSFWDLVDKLTGMPNGGKAMRLQAQGLSARYSRFQFDEAEGLRNALMASERMRIALEGIRHEQRQRKAIENLEASNVQMEVFNQMLVSRDELKARLDSTGWGGLRNPWGP